MNGAAAEAATLWRAGLNVFPIQPGSKKTYGAWSALTTTRLSFDRLPALMEGCNVAVMTGRTSGNLFVLDCDSPAQFQFVGGELEQREIPAWVRNSTRGGQFWLRCAEGEVQNAKIGQMDVLGNRKYSLAPPSVHPSGLILEWEQREGVLPPLVTLAALDFLPLELASRQAQGRVEKSAALPPRANRVLVEGDASGYDTHSEAENAACLSLLRAGYSEEAILALFRSFAPPHYRKVGERKFARYMLADAREWLAGQKDSRAARVEMSAAPFVAWAQGRGWPGRTGNSDRAVYLALCDRLKTVGSMPFRASVREVAEKSGVNRETAHTALRRLQTAGVLVRQGAEETSQSSLYCLTTPAPEQVEDVCVIRTLSAKTEPVANSVRMTHRVGDAWERRALGKTAMFVYHTLLSGVFTLADLTTVTGKHRTTVQRALQTLEAHGLAQRTEAGWEGREASEERLNQIAALCGTAGNGEWRQEKHRAERQQRAGDLIARQKERRK